MMVSFSQFANMCPFILHDVFTVDVVFEQGRGTRQIV